MNERIEFLEQLLDHLQAIAWQQLPPEVRERAVVFMADTVGVGLSAARLPDTQRLRSLAQAWGPGKCEPLGGGVRLSAPEAAFVNGFQIHCQEFDAVHEQAVVHAMSVVSGALLSDCQRSPVSGSKLPGIQESAPARNCSGRSPQVSPPSSPGCATVDVRHRSVPVSGSCPVMKQVSFL